jgi:hypothetical protein
VYHAELNMNEARRRVVLSVLGEVKPGDVFYRTADPATIWHCNPSRVTDKYMFLALGADAYRTIGHVGDGDPKQRVIIIHNTKESST